MTLDDATKKCVRGLHKGAGVWSADLHGQLTNTMLGALWGLPSDRSLFKFEAVGTVICRLEEVIYEQPTWHKTVLRTLYNLVPDHELRGLPFTQRQAAITSRYPDKASSTQSQNRILKQFQDALVESLQSPLPPLDSKNLARIVRQEDHFSEETDEFIPPEKFTNLVQQAYVAALDGPIDAFPKLRVSFGVSDTGMPIIARTSTDGDWLCVFTDPQSLTGHQEATRHRPHPRSGGSRTMSGADVVTLLSDLDHQVGILVNPPALRDGHAAGALEISPQKVMELARRP
ncbi:MAG: hypothetical protein ACJ72N_18350 [Labedaea sp.]